MKALETLALWIGYAALAVGGLAVAVIVLLALVDKAMNKIANFTKLAGAWKDIFIELHKRKAFKWQRQDGGGSVPPSMR